MRKSTTYLFVLAFAVGFVAVLATAGLVVSAQNSNSSTTMMDNTNSNKPKRRPRRPRPRPKPAQPAADTGMDAEPASTPEPMRRTGRCDPSQGEQTDLSGTYTGKVRHGNEEAMDATLTITGNDFTMSMGSDTHSGRITAVTTCGYTAVTIMHGDMTPPTPGPNPPPPNKAMSLRAKKVGNSLTLTSVAGEPEHVMFTTGGGAMRPRRHRARKPVAPPPPTE